MTTPSKFFPTNKKNIIIPVWAQLQWLLQWTRYPHTPRCTTRPLASAAAVRNSQACELLYTNFELRMNAIFPCPKASGLDLVLCRHGPSCQPENITYCFFRYIPVRRHTAHTMMLKLKLCRLFTYFINQQEAKCITITEQSYNLKWNNAREMTRY